MKPNNTIIAMQEVTKALKTLSPGDPVLIEILRRQRYALQKAENRTKGRPFIVTPSQLDRTQPTDIPFYGTPEWRDLWDKNPRHLYPKKFDHNLSTVRNLNIHVIQRPTLYHPNKNPYGIIAEVSGDGNRRCCFVKSNGMRCRNYWRLPVCRYHYKLVSAVPRMNDRFLTSIKNQSLKEAYVSHLSDPNRKSIEREIAMMRTMLDALVSRVNVGVDLNNIPIELIGAIAKLSENITGAVERMAAMETKLGMRLSLDQATALVFSVIDLVFKTCPNLEQAQLTAIADGVEKLPVMRTVSAQSIQDNAEYGTQDTNGVKLSTARDKFIDDGTVVKDAFTEAEVEAHTGAIDEHFKPRQEEHRAVMAARKEVLEKMAASLGVDETTLASKLDNIKDADVIAKLNQDMPDEGADAE
jgi:hypothetical protein